ncbi:MAG TPA: hypothetical protein VIQ56_03205, partial [Gaiella sp.]
MGTRYNHSLMADAASWLETIRRIFDAIPDLATPAEVQNALREILDDPGMRIYWWDWERDCYVGTGGDPDEPRPGAGEIATPIAYETRRIGMLVHDPKLLEAPEFTASFLPMMRIAMERDRLHRDLVAKLEQLQASRLRLVRASDSERRR